MDTLFNEPQKPDVLISDAQRALLEKAIRSTGVFVTSGSREDRVNIMATHSGALGKFWNRNVFILPVRKSKLTHELIEKHKIFAISVPVKDMRNEIISCNHLSGYNTNKFEELNLHPQRAREISTYVISECELFLECRVINSEQINEEGLFDKSILADSYEDGDFHTLYFGEVISCFEK